MGARRHFPRIEVYTVIKCASRGSHALRYCVYGNLRFGNGASWGVSTLGVRRVSHTKCPNDRPQFARKVVSVPQYTRQIGVRYLDFAIDGTCPWTPGQPSSTSISLVSELILQGINFSQWHALDPRCRLNLRMEKTPGLCGINVDNCHWRDCRSSSAIPQHTPRCSYLQGLGVARFAGIVTPFIGNMYFVPRRGSHISVYAMSIWTGSIWIGSMFDLILFFNNWITEDGFRLRLSICGIVASIGVLCPLFRCTYLERGQGRSMQVTIY
jgi:hypothetical protein